MEHTGACVCNDRGIRRRVAVKTFDYSTHSFARLSLRLPIAGSLLATLCAARWSRALGTLLSAGTSLSDAFDSLTHATGNAFFDRATSDIAGRLRRGERLAAAMRATRCFPAEIIQPVAVAEESGALDSMLLDVASLSDRQVDEQIGTLASLCEPLVIMVLGVLVGGLVIAMYLPIIQLGNVV
jgi:type IV pilus assembly protein PilC